MKSIKEQIEEEVRFDGLSHAEKITGRDYKECKITESIGFVEHLKHVTRMNNLMDCMDDTKFSESEEEYMRKVKDAGFKELLCIKFTSEKHTEKGKEPNIEKLYIMFNYELSILLKWDTFWGDRNSASFYYNWSPNDIFDRKSVTSSGGFINNGASHRAYSYLFNQDFTPYHLPVELIEQEPELAFHEPYYTNEYKPKLEKWNNDCKSYIKTNNLVSIWKGNHDGREALKFHIRQLQENGIFLKKWKEQPFLWLLHYGDTEQEGYDHKKINEERIKMLPTDVQEIIRGE